MYIFLKKKKKIIIIIIIIIIIVIIIIIKFHSWKGPWETILTLLSVCEAYMRKQCYNEKIRLEFQGMNDLQVTERVSSYHHRNIKYYFILRSAA